MFDEDSDLMKQDIDLEQEIKQIEQKAKSVVQQQERYNEFSKLVLNSIKMMEQKFTEMQSKYDKALLNKENQNTQKPKQKCVSVGKVSVVRKQPIPVKQKITKLKK